MTVKRYHSYDTLVPPERRDVVLATDYDLLAASNAALRELLREWIIGWGGFNSDDLKPGGLVIRTRAALKQNRRHEIAL